MNQFSGTGQATESIGGQEEDALFDALRDRRRRYALRYVPDDGTTVEVHALAKELAAWERERETGDGPSGDPTRIEVALVHIHLPKLEEMGLLDYDSGAGTVRQSDRTEEARPHLEAITPSGDR